MHTRRPSSDAPRLRLGRVLRLQGRVHPGTLSAALAAQARSGAPLGQILTSHGALRARDVAQGLARQAGLGFVNLDRTPADPTLSAGMDPAAFLRLGFLPWALRDGVLICALADPRNAGKVSALLPDAGADLSFVVAEPAKLEAAIARIHAPLLAQQASVRCPDRFACRGWASGGYRGTALACLALLCAVLYPMVALLMVLGWIVAINTLSTVFRGVALAHSFQTRPRRRLEPVLTARDPAKIVALDAHRPLPIVTILVPLFHEERTLRALIQALGRTTYPLERLDVILVLEQDDLRTALSLAQITLPPWMRTVTVPTGSPKTKPRALNYAMGFARGEIVGIYDAEDRPDPDQVHKIVDHFAQGGPKLACVQGYLDFYNPRQNWLSRCFTVEYAIWFRVLLGGVQRLGMPIPLGGTTVFLRRAVLDAVGGWDAHNVTEDADLGMRLARFGYATQMVATTTREEANCRPLAWVTQRSRWLKGYAVTWRTHMRNPVQLWRDLGPVGFVGFQVLFLGGLTSYLAIPLLWMLWGAYLGFDVAVFAVGPVWMWAGFTASMLIGQAVMLAVALRAVWPRERRHLLWVVPTLVLYWPLGALAAYRAVVELFTRPFHWHKTEHGL